MPWSRAPSWMVPSGCAPKPVWLNTCSSPLCSSAPDSSCLSHPLWDAVVTHSPLAMAKPVLLGQPRGECRQTCLTWFPWAKSLLSLLHLLQTQLSTLTTLVGFLPINCVCVCVCVCPQSHLALCNPMDCSPLGSSVYKLFQARILERDTISYS